MFHVEQLNEHGAASALHPAWMAALGAVKLPPGARERMAHHWALVQQWNARTNLTAIDDEETAVWRHYWDSLVALPRMRGGPVVDFGTGAGFPGMVLAMARPDWDFTLVEPRRKRVSFLEVACARLQLQNVTVHHGRLEDPADRPYMHAVSRATFADDGMMPLATVHAHVARWLMPHGSLLLYRSAGVVTGSAAVQPPILQHPYTVLAASNSAETSESQRMIAEWSAAQLHGDNRTIAPSGMPVV